MHHVRSILNKTTALLLMVALLAGSFPPVQTQAAAAQIRQEINILDGEPMTSPGTLESQARVLLDTTAYSGTKTYYFEVVHSGAASNTGTIKLSRAGTSTYDASIAGATSTSTTLTRSTAFTPPAGQTEYTVTLVGDGVRSQTVKSARIIVIQNSDPLTATQTQIEIGNYETEKTNTSAAALSAPKYWKYDATKWEGSISATAEIVWKKTNGSTRAVPTFVAKGAFASGAAALTVGVPATYQDNDVFLLFVETANQAITTPSGWTQVTNSPQSTGTAAAAGGVRLGVFYKVVSGSQSSVTVADSGDHQTAIIMNFRGVDTTTPIDISAGSVGAASTSMVFPTATTTMANTLVVLAAGMDTDGNSTATMGNVTNANLSNIVEQHDQTVNTGAGGGLVVVTATKATAGATSTSSATGSTSVTHAYMTIALRPTPVATTFTAKLQESDGTGDGFVGWTDKVTIANAVSTDATITRTRSSSFTPVTGRNYRIVTNQSDSLASYITYSAKLIVNSALNTEAGNITTASYTNKSFSPAVQGGDTRGISFSSDGTNMYTFSNSNSRVYQYTLSTAWDVSTASYSNKSFLINTQDTAPRNFQFSSDGTIMYVVGDTNNTVYQYTLSTAWDVSTASYASKSFSVGTQDGAPIKVEMSSDGTKMYVLGTTNDTVYQYTLSTAWDVSTASYASKSFATTTQTTAPSFFEISSDGTRMYVGQYTAMIYQYTLSTAWDVSTASYASKSFDPSAQDTAIYGLFLSSNDIDLYIAGSNQPYIFQYTLAPLVTSITKLEPQYLLANTSLAAGTSLQNFLTKWDSSEWSGVTTEFSHVVDSADASTSVVEVNTAAGVQVIKSSVTTPDNQGFSNRDFSEITNLFLTGLNNQVNGIIENNDYIYAAVDNQPIKIVRINTSTFSIVDTLTLAAGNDQLSGITEDNDYLYVGTLAGPSPANVIRINKSDFSTTTVKTLEVGDNSVTVITSDDNYVYVGVESAPARIIRINKSDFSTTTVKTLAENYPQSISSDTNYIYVGITTNPSRVVRINKSDFSTTATKIFSSGESSIGHMYGDTTHLYVALQTTPGKVVRILKSDFSTAVTKTLDTGDNGTRKITGDTDYVYVGTGTSPTKVIRINKSDFSTTQSLTMLSSSNPTTAIISASDYIYEAFSISVDRYLSRIKKIGSFLTMPTNGNLDVKATTNNGDIYASRILVAVSQATTSSYEQSGFRFFGNANSTNVGSPLAALNTSATLSNSNDQFRLRMTLHVSGAALDTTGQNFKLQYAARSGTCDTSFSGETYADVTATTPIAYYENFDATHGATLTTNANDPTHGGDTVVAQSYVETNNFTNPSAIAVGQDGKWDFALHDRGTTSSAVYCLRVVKSDGSTLNTYTYIPQVTTAIYTPRGGGGGNAGGESSGGGTPTGGGTGQGGGSGSEGSGGGTPTGGGTGSGGGGGDVGFLIPSSWFAQDSFFALITSLFARR